MKVTEEMEKQQQLWVKEWMKKNKVTKSHKKEAKDYSGQKMYIKTSSDY